MEVPRAHIIASKDDLSRDDQLALLIGKLVRTCSFMEYWTEMQIIGRVPEATQKFAKLAMAKAPIDGKLDTLQVLLSLTESTDRMEQWACLRKEVRAVFDRRNDVAHGVFANRVSDHSYVLHSLRTGKSGDFMREVEYDIEKVREAAENAHEASNKFVIFCLKQD